MRENHRETADQRLAVNLRTLRERKGMSQAALAAAMSSRGIPWHQQTVGRVEAGQQQARYSEAVELAAILETSLDRLNWSPPEASATELVYSAGYRVRQSYEAVAEAVHRLLADLAAAQRALDETEGNPSPRVQEARKDTDARIGEHGLDEAVAEGVRRWEERTGDE